MQRISQAALRANSLLFNRKYKPDNLTGMPWIDTARYMSAGAAASTTGTTTGPRLDANQEPRFLEQVKLFYNEAASKTGLEEQYLNYISKCQTVIRFNIPLRRDDGRLEVITCYR